MQAATSLSRLGVPFVLAASRSESHLTANPIGLTLSSFPLESDLSPRSFRLSTRRFGELLVDSGRISSEDLNRALKSRQDARERLGQTLVRLGILDEGEGHAKLADRTPERGSLPRVHLLPQGTDSPVLRGNLVEDVPASISRAVVDGDHLAHLRLRQYVTEDDLEGLLFVVDRHHDAERAVAVGSHAVTWVWGLRFEAR